MTKEKTIKKLFALNAISTLILIASSLWTESWAKTHNLSCQARHHEVPNMDVAQVFLKNAQFVEMEGNEFYDYAINDGHLSVFLHNRDINYHHTSTVLKLNRRNIQRRPDESEVAFHLPLLSSQREMLFVFSREVLKDESQLKEFTAYATVTDLPGVTVPLDCQLRRDFASIFGKADFIFPKNAFTVTDGSEYGEHSFTAYTILSWISDHFGTTVALNCSMERRTTL